MSSDGNKETLATPGVGNGGQGEGYTWTQTLSELSVVVKVAAETTAQSVKCDIEDNHIRLSTNGKQLLCGDLEHAVHTDECFWQIDRQDATVSIHMEKKDKMNWWACVVKGHAKIELSKIEPDNSRLDDLDGETRGMVEKMMYNQRQKAAGLPTADEQQKLNAFDKFKKQHPEMDFSNAKLQ